jgi:ribosome-associated toxin RatA of RatAB toxin-antitoxin module
MTFKHSVIIPADTAALFALSQDYESRLKWDPFLKSAMLRDNARSPAVGVRALCIAYSGLQMETVYVSYNPPRTCAVKMTQGPRFIDSFAGTWHFETVAAGQTRVSFRYHLKARPRWLSWLLTPLLVWRFGRETRARLTALKQAAAEPC